MKILYTGYGSSQYGQHLKKINKNLSIFFASTKDCDLLSKDSIENFTNSNTYFDVVITGANRSPGYYLKDFNSESITISINHLLLIESFENKPKYFINLTTGLNSYDEHFIYRAQKTFSEDLYKRYFTLNPETRMINFHPNHISDENIIDDSAKILLNMISNIEQYKEYDYVAIPEMSKLEPINTRY